MKPSRREPTDEEKKLMACSHELGQIVTAHARKHVVMSGPFVQEVEDICKQYTTMARMAGVKFPDVVVVFSPEIGYVEIVRADLEEDGLRQLVKNIAVKYEEELKGRPDAARIVTDSLLRAFPAMGRRVDIDTTVRRDN